MDSLADKGTKPCLAPYKQLDEAYWTGGPFNQLAEFWPITPASKFTTDELHSLPLLNLDLNFIEQSELSQQPVNFSGLKLMQLADQLPAKKPPFWKLMAKYRCFQTSAFYLISLSKVLAMRFPKHFPGFVDKNRMELYDIILTKLLHQENPVSDTIVKFIMQSQNDYIVKEVDRILFVMGQCGEIVNPGFIA